MKVSFTVSPVLAGMVSDLAERLGVSVSEAYRILIVQGFEKLSDPEHPLSFSMAKKRSAKK